MDSDSNLTLEILSSRVFDTDAERLFEAFADPAQLGQWWGPHGFTNRVTALDLRVGGDFRIVMTNSDGLDFDNHSTFEAVERPALIRFLHHLPMHVYRMHMHFAPTEDGTRLTWRMQFERNAENLKLKTFIAAANEQNFDRLSAFLAQSKGNTMTTTQTPDPARMIEITRLVDAPRDLVFSVFTEPGHIDQWWGPDGFRNETHEMDFSVGGLWRYTMHGPDGKDWPNWIRYTEIEPGRRLAYDHGGEMSEPAHFQGETVFEDEGQGTRVTLRLIFPSVEARNATLKYGAIEGGEQTLARLAAYAVARYRG